MSEHLAVENKRGLSPAALLVAGAFFMEFIDGTVIATALPDMAKSFGVHAVDLNIGISAYLITLAVLIPASGWIADRFGARKVFTLALAIFTLASVLCGLSESLESFVAMRILQGVGGALMVPVGRLAVLRTTPKHQLITAIATLTWPALVAPIIGPPLGGFITSYANWRWIFFINVPLGILAIALALRFIPDIHDDERRPFDITGFIATSVAMVSLVYAMELLGTQQPQGWLTAGLLALGTVTFLFALNVLALLACALITPQTPVWVILLVLYLGGVFRSIQFTGVSTLAFADVPAAQMSYANTLFSTATQLAVGLGISLAAIGIRIGDVVSEKLALGNIPGISFRLAFVAIAIICLVGMVDTLRLTRDAGSAVSNKNR